MTPFQRRLFILLDEWLGVLLLYHLRSSHDPFFWPVLAVWVVAVYFVSYPLHWRGK